MKSGINFPPENSNVDAYAEWRLFIVGAGAEDATAAVLEFEWSAGAEGSHRETVLADEQLVQTAWITSFNQPGLHTIGRLFLSNELL